MIKTSKGIQVSRSQPVSGTQRPISGNQREDPRICSQRSVIVPDKFRAIRPKAGAKNRQNLGLGSRRPGWIPDKFGAFWASRPDVERRKCDLAEEQALLSTFSDFKLKYERKTRFPAEKHQKILQKRNGVSQGRMRPDFFRTDSGALRPKFRTYFGGGYRRPLGAYSGVLSKDRTRQYPAPITLSVQHGRYRN